MSETSTDLAAFASQPPEPAPVAEVAPEPAPPTIEERVAALEARVIDLSTVCGLR